MQLPLSVSANQWALPQIDRQASGNNNNHEENVKTQGGGSIMSSLPKCPENLESIRVHLQTQIFLFLPMMPIELLASP